MLSQFQNEPEGVGGGGSLGIYSRSFAETELEKLNVFYFTGQEPQKKVSLETESFMLTFFSSWQTFDKTCAAPALVAQHRHWWRSTGTGGAVPSLVAQYRHWWRSTGTGGAVPALVAQ